MSQPKPVSPVLYSHPITWTKWPIQVTFDQIESNLPTWFLLGHSPWLVSSPVGVVSLPLHLYHLLGACLLAGQVSDLFSSVPHPNSTGYV